MKCADCKHEWDGLERKRTCPRCKSPFWEGRMEITNYPAQEGFRGAVGCTRSRGIEFGTHDVLRSQMA